MSEDTTIIEDVQEDTLVEETEQETVVEETTPAEDSTQDKSLTESVLNVLYPLLYGVCLIHLQQNGFSHFGLASSIMSGFGSSPR